MEFILSELPSYLASRKAVVQYLLNKLDLIDERETSGPRLAQEVFLLKHRKELSRKVEKRLAPKVLEDIDFILENEWAKEISKQDFYHGHICSASQLPVFDLDVLLSEVNARLLYHTFEVWREMPYFSNRNIKSSLVSKPEVIPIAYEELDSGYWKTYRFSKIGVSSSELGWSEYGKIEFEENPNGCYKLKNGTRLDMVGILNDHLIFHIRIKNGSIQLDGKTIGRIKPFEIWSLEL
jgi:hypothetical protein